jgi:nucleotide-binding universal stress UspA family protein
MSSTKPAPSQKPQAPEAAAAPIVVGFDDSDEGRDALELARVLCEARGARCIVATVLEWGPVAVRRAISDDEEGEAEPLFEEARKALSGLEVETRVVGTRSPGRMLAEFAEREGASTLVVGAPHHRTSAGRVLLGSVAEHLLHHSPCEVTIAPRGYGETSLTHVGLDQVAVAYDGTAESRQALRHAVKLAAAAGATIEVLVVKDPVTDEVEEERPAKEGPGHAVLDQALAAIPSSVSASGRVLEAPHRETVPKVAEALARGCDADVLVCGSRPPVDRIFLSSVTKHVIQMSIHPVLVVPGTLSE